MKKIIVALMLITFAVTVAYAADTVTYDGGKKGAVSFDHKAHQAKFECAACHEGTPAKIAVDGKKTGHAVCKDCHKKNKAAGASTKCGACHVK